jgi:hypothetical protein
MPQASTTQTRTFNYTSGTTIGAHAFEYPNHFWIRTPPMVVQ